MPMILISMILLPSPWLLAKAMMIIICLLLMMINY